MYNPSRIQGLGCWQHVGQFGPHNKLHLPQSITRYALVKLTRYRQLDALSERWNFPYQNCPSVQARNALNIHRPRVSFMHQKGNALHVSPNHFFLLKYIGQRRHELRLDPPLTKFRTLTLIHKLSSRPFSGVPLRSSIIRIL
jgi:hypothetical protein